MKNKYFGDINDYHKYGLLRVLSNRGKIRTAVCWMRTRDDGPRKDHVPEYLRQGDKYKSLDPELFESLARCLKTPRRRSIRLARRPGILPFAVPFEGLLPQDPDKRRKYIRRLLAKAHECSVVFFDPDTGLKLMWSPRRGKTSGTHLYLDEVQMTFCSGHSVLVYQHFPRKPRDQFVRDLSNVLCELCHVRIVYSFRTSRVVFLLVPQLDLLDYFDRCRRKVRRIWGQSFSVTRHRAARKAFWEWAAVDLDAGLLRALRHRAARMNRSLSDLINATVRQSLAEDLEDLAEFNERAKEPNLALEAVLKDSRRRGKL